MRTVLEPPGSTTGAPDRGAGLRRPTIRNGAFDDGVHGWQTLGMPFRVVTLENRDYLCTYLPQGPGEQNGDGVKGALYQDFTLDDRATTLCFRVHGGGVLTPTEFETRNIASVGCTTETRSSASPSGRTATLTRTSAGTSENSPVSGYDS